MISSSPIRLKDLLACLETSLRALGLVAGDCVLVAFSGGPDSLALLHLLSRLAPGFPLSLQAAHFDHGLDSGSRARADQARLLAERLGVPITLARCRRSCPPGESREEFARHERYLFLEDIACQSGSRYIVTAHHADDQAETVLLRMIFGSGLDGLAAIRPSRGAIVRPCLNWRREFLRAALHGLELEPIADPTNDDQRIRRNSLRRNLMPQLENAIPDLVPRLGALAATAARARARLDERLGRDLEIEATAHGARCSRVGLEGLVEPLFGLALARLDRRAGAELPAAREARAELRRQLGAGKHVRVDCGRSLIWGADREFVWAERAQPPGQFTYTLEAPGVVRLPELDLCFRLEIGPVEPWMFAGDARRAGLAVETAESVRFEVRNRRPGDQFHPLGASSAKSLNDFLIDRKVPRNLRDRLPLLLIGGRIAWVPGAAIDRQFRLRAHHCHAWIASLQSTSS